MHLACAQLGQLDQNLVVFNFHFVFFRREIGYELVLAAGNIIAPAMPGADHRGAVQFALAQRAAPMAAYVVDGVKLAVDIEYTDGFTIDLNAFASAGFDVAGLTNLDKIGHSLFPFIYPRKFRLIYGFEEGIQGDVRNGTGVTVAPALLPSRWIESSVPGCQKSLCT